MPSTGRTYLLAFRDGVLGGAAAALVVYVLALLAATTGMLAGVLGDTYDHSLMGITITRQQDGEAVVGSVAMSGLTAAGIVVLGALVALSRCRRATRAHT